MYTPTVGWAALNYSVIHRRPRGFYFSQKDRAHFSSMLWNSPRMEVDAIVVTDGCVGCTGVGCSVLARLASLFDVPGCPRRAQVPHPRPG